MHHQPAAGRHRLLLAVLCLLLYLPGFTSLPPFDRDEARFAQATRQMIESGDYLVPYFQQHPRYRKPPGIYWLQAAAVEAGGGLPAPIWVYRLPSLAGALLAVLLSYGLGVRLLERDTALLGAALLACCFVLVSEAHQGKADAVLLACTVVAQSGLARVYVAARGGARAGLGPALAFWLATGLGILVKGPVTPMVGALTALALSVADRDASWLRGLRPALGLPVLALVALPPLLATEVASGGHFLQRSVEVDLLPKLVGGVESHGAPPGFYVALAPLALWPASVLLPHALTLGLRARRETAVRFCLAWALPTWLVFELVPTKLLHYTLVTFPALALLAAMAARTHDTDGRGLRIASRAWLVPWCLAGLALAALPLFATARFGHGPGVAAALTTIAVLATMAGVVPAVWRGKLRRAALLGIVSAVPVYMLLAGAVLPTLDALRVSGRVVAAARRASGNQPLRLASAGYVEPSLVFLAGTDTLLTTGGGAAQFLAAHPGGVAAVEARQRAAFRRAAHAEHLRPCLRGEVDGVNYSKVRRVSIDIYTAPRDGTCATPG